jgi:hypothetical protein
MGYYIMDWQGQMEKNFMRFQIAACLLLGLMGLAAVGVPALADCRSDKQQATTLLMNFKQDSLNNQAVSQDQFKAQFEPVVHRMKAQGCMSELMGLMNLIQSEQQQY